MNILSKIGGVAVLCGIAFISIHAVQEAPTDEILEKKIINDYNVYALPIPEYMEFAGESVPLNNPDIRERMDRELLVNTYWQSNALLMFKRANKYFPIIEPLLEKYGLPDDFKYLAVAESGLDNVRSPAGAAGFWQFLSSTGKEYGLEINDYVDERYNLELATKVAAEYLKKSNDKFGSWTAAAAAYNAGNGGVNKQMVRQDVTDYYDLLLNSETSRYVFRILAFKEIMSNPKKYGFNFRDQDLYQPIPTYNLKVDKPVDDFAQFAKEQGINYKILKIHNPWLRDTYLKNASGKEYYIQIPEKGYYTMGQ
ncbi:lytic transglycosylase domain-containing protein [Cochleicola gelatinilyticus]|uniref:Murein transglycosylase n=1 Tax=Cochleicola gelatinilyticus TaxID=1763537 RepID=A0A167H454_9FLAO|nr:lytic transglycosylase domain-containing protein [Cochleicola gelatinilyticus]OAB78196.1 murein transglycosylase [Cochleicola gelatinilyticus]